MARPPAYMFVVRHGMRLDAADKTWAESSPTPYDTPLCYAGWIQARAVGARIATILAQAEAESETPDSPILDTVEKPRQRRRRFKVAIHCSPFLRCVQTAVGISAGLAQPITAPPTVPATSRRQASNPVVIPSPILKPTRSSKPAPIPETLGDGLSDSQHHHHYFHKAILRLDEFLGEWLSAEYYETISPPPKASTMIANAKAQLLKREIYSQNFHRSLTSPQSPPPVLSPQLWTGGRNLNTASVPEDPFDEASDEEEKADLPPPRPLGELGYVAPVPHYAIYSSDKIPDGFVAHARDSCVVFDYQWESSGREVDWGNGGTFPEEWTSMHNRFRKGVQGLVDWYSTTKDAADIAHIRGAAEKDKIEDTWSEDGDDDVDIESVVIMVSHGAGCNALIGAMTHQPALMDVSMASLTMAVRKSGSEYEHVSPFLPNTDQTDDTSLSTIKNSIPVHQYYDMRLVASTEHLRTNSSSAGLGRSGVIASWGTPLNKHLKSPTLVGSRARVSTMISSPISPVIRSFSSTSDGLSSSPTHNRSSSMSMSASFGLNENTGLFGPRRGEDADYQFSALNGNSGGITVGSGVTSFMKKRDNAGMLKNVRPAPLRTDFGAPKGLYTTTIAGRIGSPLVASTTWGNEGDQVVGPVVGPVAPLAPLKTTLSISNGGLWGINNLQTPTLPDNPIAPKAETRFSGDEDEDDDFFPDFDNKKKFTPPISQNASEKTSPTLWGVSIKTSIANTGTLSPPLGSPTLLSLSSSDFSSGDNRNANGLSMMRKEPQFGLSKFGSPGPASPPAFEFSGVRGSDGGNMDMDTAIATTNRDLSGAMWSGDRLDRTLRLGVAPVRSPIHSPIGSPAREPLASPFFGEEGEMRTRMTRSRMWGTSK